MDVVVTKLVANLLERVRTPLFYMSSSDQPTATHDYGCCEVGGQFMCAQLTGGVCPEISHNQDSVEDKGVSIMEVVEVESKEHSSLQLSPSNSKWIVGTIGGLLIVAGLIFMVKRRRNYHIESAHLLSSQHAPLY